MDLMKLQKQQLPNYTKIAALSGVAWDTAKKAVITPDNVTLKNLRKIYEAIGYRLTVVLEPIENEEAE